MEKLNKAFSRNAHRGQVYGRTDGRMDGTEFIGPCRLCRGSNKVFLIRDIHLNRINKENFCKEFNGDWVYFKNCPGANTKQLDYYSIPMLVHEKPNITFTNIGSNNITKWNYHTTNPDELAKGILNIGFKYYGVSQIDILSILVRSTNDLNKDMLAGKFSLRSLCQTYGLAFIYNKNIHRNRLWRWYSSHKRG